MSSEDWYRNTEWSPKIAASFFSRLERSRKWNTAQYLRIQASYLAGRSPTVALELIDRFFTLDPEQTQIESASAHLVRANAYTTLGDSENAVRSFDAAIARERVFPNAQTSAWSEYARFVVVNRLQHLYPRILGILDEHCSSALLLLNSEVFTWNASKALILAESGFPEEATPFAQAALNASQKAHSGLMYHPDVGMVEQSDPLLKAVRTLMRSSGAKPT